MLNWIKSLFGKKENDVVFYELSIQTQLRNRYNVRDKFGRFVKGNTASKNTPRAKNGRFKKGNK